MAHPLSGAAAIVGLGITPQGRVYGNTPVGFAVDAMQLALADAGLERKDLDGLLLNPGLAWADMGMGSFQLQQAMGLRNLRLSATMNLGGATACAMIQHASQAIAAGLATTVVCVFSDMPLKPPAPKGDRASAASAYGFARGWEQAYGFFGVNAMYALVARRHMHRYGTSQDHLGAVAVGQRRWATLNPAAQLRDQPLTLEDYGFCAKGEGGPFAAEQVTGPGGRVAVNTGGGQLASFYMWGMTPVSEAVIQLRGDGGARQVPRHDVALVSGNGGILSTHSTLILSRLPS